MAARPATHLQRGSVSTPTGSARHAGATANLKLTFHLDHSAGADHMSNAPEGRLQTFWHGQGDGQAPLTWKLSSYINDIWRTPSPPKTPFRTCSLPSK